MDTEEQEIRKAEDDAANKFLIRKDEDQKFVTDFMVDGAVIVTTRGVDTLKEAEEDIAAMMKHARRCIVVHRFD